MQRIPRESFGGYDTAIDGLDRACAAQIGRLNAKLDWVQWFGLMGSFIGFLCGAACLKLGVDRFTLLAFAPPVPLEIFPLRILHEALVITAWSLVISIVFFAAYQILRNRTTCGALRVRNDIAMMLNRVYLPSGKPAGQCSRFRLMRYVAADAQETLQPNLAAFVNLVLVLLIVVVISIVFF